MVWGLIQRTEFQNCTHHGAAAVETIRKHTISNWALAI